MNNKTNIFVCVLIALLISLQCNISVYADDENDSTATTDIVSTEIPIKDEAAGNEIIDGTEFTLDSFAEDDQMQ